MQKGAAFEKFLNAISRKVKTETDAKVRRLAYWGGGER